MQAEMLCTKALLNVQKQIIIGLNKHDTKEVIKNKKMQT